MTSTINIGDRVTVIGVPPELRDCQQHATRSLFEACVGQSFVVEGQTDALAELRVGRVFGEPDAMQTIWVEPQYLRHQA